MHLAIEIWVMLDCSPHKKLIYTKEELEKVEVNVIDTKPPNESLFIMQNSTSETLPLSGFQRRESLKYPEYSANR